MSYTVELGEKWERLMNRLTEEFGKRPNLEALLFLILAIYCEEVFFKLFISSLYFVSSFGGILFSCTFNPLAYSVGASTAIFGLIGYYIAYLCIEWSRLGESNPM
jgi:hypothetical protein